MPSTPYMKLYVGDYLGDTQHLSCLEHGAYILLIMAYWQNGGPLKNDVSIIRRITKTSLKEYKNMYGNVLNMFDLRDGMLVHNRIEKEIAKREQVSTKARDSANSRWNERKADAVPTQSGRNATPIFHSPESILNTNNTSPAKPSKDKYTESFNAFWESYPRREGKGQAAKVYNSKIKQGITPDEIQSRLSVYKAQIEAAGTLPQYIRHPGTFLNNLDDYPDDARPKPKEPLNECLPYREKLEHVTLTQEEREMIARSYGVAQ